MYSLIFHFLLLSILFCFWYLNLIFFTQFLHNLINFRFIWYLQRNFNAMLNVINKDHNTKHTHTNYSFSYLMWIIFYFIINLFNLGIIFLHLIIFRRNFVLNDDLALDYDIGGLAVSATFLINVMVFVVLLVQVQEWKIILFCNHWYFYFYSQRPICYWVHRYFIFCFTDFFVYFLW